MRKLLAVLAVVALVAAPSFGVINITLKGRVGTTGTFASTVDLTGKVGQTLTVQIFGQGTDSGLLAVGGDVVASGGQSLGTPTQVSWTAKSHFDADVPTAKIFDVGGSFTGAGFQTLLSDSDGDGVNDTLDGYVFASSAYPAGRPSPVDITNFNKGGTPGANGAVGALGSGQAPGASLDANFAKAAPVLLGTYTVPVTASNDMWLNWVDAALVGGTHVGYGGWYSVGTTAGDWAPGTLTGLHLTPEPATMALLALGGLMIARRRRA